MTLLESHVALLIVVAPPAFIAGAGLALRDPPLGFGLTYVLAQALTIACVLVYLFAFDLLEALRHGRPHVPPCAACGAADFTAERTLGTTVWTCPCGRRFVRHGLQCRELLPGGATRPYRRWRPFRRWLDDSAAIADLPPAPYRGSDPPA